MKLLHLNDAHYIIVKATIGIREFQNIIYQHENVSSCSKLQIPPERTKPTQILRDYSIPGSHALK